LERPPRKAGSGAGLKKKREQEADRPVPVSLTPSSRPRPRAALPACAIQRAHTHICIIMASTAARQDAKHERALKALLKLPDNRRCADCDTLVRRGNGGRGRETWSARARQAGCTGYWCEPRMKVACPRPCTPVARAVLLSPRCASAVPLRLCLPHASHALPSPSRPQGPQYVVTDFNIFVCAVCSGVQYVFLERRWRFAARKKRGGGKAFAPHAPPLLSRPLSHDVQSTAASSTTGARV